jgi:hypothetical protein
MWFIADGVAQKPEMASLPFYEFGCYLGERFMTCVFHSAFVAASLSRKGRSLALVFLGAVAMHWPGNFPISLMAWNLWGLGRTTWSAIVQIRLLLYFFVAVGLLSVLALGRVNPSWMLFGRRRCPECKRDCDTTLFALNMRPTCYERCPHCRHWHWTRKSATPEENSQCS